MATIVLRSTKGSALTFQEGDDNFNNLNTDKLEDITNESIGDLSDVNITIVPPGDGDMLIYNGVAGEWGNVAPAFLEEVADDPAPHLGGDLVLNSSDITGTGNINITGNAVAQSALNAQTGASYTLALTDASKLVTMSNGSGNTLTIPPNSSVAFPVGTKVDIAQLGAGQTTVAAGLGVTVNATPSLLLRAQYSAATCIKTATDTWLLVGDLETP